MVARRTCSDTAKENKQTIDTNIKEFLKNPLPFPRKNKKIIFDDVLCKIFHFSLDAPYNHSKFNFSLLLFMFFVLGSVLTVIPITLAKAVGAMLENR